MAILEAFYHIYENKRVFIFVKEFFNSLRIRESDRLPQSPFHTLYSSLTKKARLERKRGRWCISLLEQPFLLKLSHKPIVDQLLGFEAAKFFIGESQHPEAVADTV
jgi:hypothetical protein